MTIKPHDSLGYYKPDEVAECFDGVSTEMYGILWNRIVPLYEKPASDYIEWGGGNDDPYFNSIERFWDKFSDDEKNELNKIAILNDEDEI